MPETAVLPRLEFTVENDKKTLTAVIAAAGNSERLGKDKILTELLGRPAVLYSLLAFEKCQSVSGIVLVANEKNIRKLQKICSENCITKLTDIVLGGEERLLSVANGIEKCRGDYVAVHDGARPLVTPEIIEKVFKYAIEYGGAAAGCPVKSTLKLIDEYGIVESTPDRSRIFEAQTPQIFCLEKYKEALEAAIRDKSRVYTDDCMVFEAAGGTVKMTDCGYENIKITTAEDIIMAEEILKSREAGV